MLNIPEDELPHVEWLAGLSGADFEKFFEALSTAPAKLTVSEFADSISEKVSNFLPAAQLQSVLKTLFAIHWLKDRSGVPTPEFSTDVVSAIVSQSKNKLSISGDHLADRFARILGLSSVGVTAKALDVMTEHERVLRGVRILTDMRPVFLEDGEKVAAAMIVHQLQISFYESGMQKELYFALDENDLNSLILASDRAERKAKVLEKIITDAKLEYLKV